MKNLTFILFISISVFAQKKDYKKRIKSDFYRFLTQTEEIYFVEDIINKSSEFGFEILRLNNGEIIGESSIANYIILTKSIRDDNIPFIPPYSIGNIVKKIFFLGTNLEDAIQICTITEIRLLEYPNVSYSSINNSYNSTIEFIKKYINENYNNIRTGKVYIKPLYDLYYENKYPYLDKFEFTNVSNDYESDITFSFGKRTESLRNTDGSYSRHFFLGFQHHNNFWDDLTLLRETSTKLNSNASETFKSLRNKIGDKNIEEINTYDLQEMVQFFLDDCKRSKIIVPSIETLSATFEPLEEGVIALAYGMDNDDQIIIRVDPTNWQKSDLVKKWYVIYHELGHDVLNLNHGEGGKMMFNFADRDYTWDEFYIDKDYMFKYFLERQ